MTDEVQTAPTKQSRKPPNRGQDIGAEEDPDGCKASSNSKTNPLPEIRIVENTYLHTCSRPNLSITTDFLTEVPTGNVTYPHPCARSQYSLEKSTTDFLVDIPKDVGGLSVDEVLQCLHCLNLTKHVETFLVGQVDGELLVSIDREMLTAELGFQSFEAMKLEKFARHGWRPKLVRVHDQSASLASVAASATFFL